MDVEHPLQCHDSADYTVESSTTIHDLPAEILCDIIAFASEYFKAHKRHITLVVATHVCRRWRDVAISRSSLWSTIHTRYAPKGLIAEMLERSRDAPLTAFIHIFSMADNEAASLVLHHLHRIRALDVEVSTKTYFEALIPTLDQSLPKLETLRLASTPSSGSIIIPDSFLEEKITQRLKMLTLSGPSMFWGSKILHGLSRLCVTFKKVDAVDWYEILDLLAQNPELEELGFTFMEDCSYRDVVANRPKVKLLALRHLTLEMDVRLCQQLKTFIYIPNVVDCSLTFPDYPHNCNNPVFALPQHVVSRHCTAMKCSLGASWIHVEMNVCSFLNTHAMRLRLYFKLDRPHTFGPKKSVALSFGILTGLTRSPFLTTTPELDVTVGIDEHDNEILPAWSRFLSTLPNVTILKLALRNLTHWTHNLSYSAALFLKGMVVTVDPRTHNLPQPTQFQLYVYRLDIPFTTLLDYVIQRMDDGNPLDELALRVYQAFHLHSDQLLRLKEWVGSVSMEDAE